MVTCPPCTINLSINRSINQFWRVWINQFNFEVSVGLVELLATLRDGRSSSIAGEKRTSSQAGARLPPNKRPCSTLPPKAGREALSNRVHRRVILRDFGDPIYKARSLPVLLGALADCVEGHQSLRQKAGLLHRDISIGNLVARKDGRGMLIDLDLAAKEERSSASGAKGKTGTRAFMAIGVPSPSTRRGKDLALDP
jgi:hypothetical protein